MTKKQLDEKAIFDAFEKLCPNFAGRSVVSVPGTDPPDILSTDKNGVRIGVELGEWVNAGQIAAAKAKKPSKQALPKLSTAGTRCRQSTSESPG